MSLLLYSLSLNHFNSCAFSDIQFIAVRLTVAQKNVFTNCSYIAPNSVISVCNKQGSVIREVVDNTKTPDVIIVLGDFNLSNVSWRSNSDTGWLIAIGAAHAAKCFSLYK